MLIDALLLDVLGGLYSANLITLAISFLDAVLLLLLAYSEV